MLWPGNKSFAFSVFDDTDSQTLEKGKAVYALLADLGFRTTKSVWPIRVRCHGSVDTCTVRSSQSAASPPKK